MPHGYSLLVFILFHSCSEELSRQKIKKAATKRRGGSRLVVYSQHGDSVIADNVWLYASVKGFTFILLNSLNLFSIDVLQGEFCSTISAAKLGAPGLREQKLIKTSQFFIYFRHFMTDVKKGNFGECVLVWTSAKNRQFDKNRPSASRTRARRVPYHYLFQLELSNRFECLQSCQSVDEINNRSLRRDIRNFNTNCIEEAIERNKGSKVFARDVSVGQSQLTKLKTDDGRIASTKAEVLREIENFYGQLYTSVALPVSSSTVDPRAKLTRHYTEDIPDISLYEIRMALKQLKNNKAPGEDGITSELLHAGGTPVLKVLQKLFNSVLLEGITPEAWNRSVVVLFFKKGDNTLLKNYRPISLLSHVYKLFSRVITNRLARRFDDFQPPEQAGFRKGYSTIDHIHTLRQVIQKTEEYNLPLCLAFVDYEKAFDSIETWAVLQSLQRCHIDYRYVEV
ncbi:hypothetical protein ABMA28_001919 [Loxostege sticticalis]|uniref:Reverse transcriptase domain-containing protein n=1 Tax=Loxostege sticticalis TaxID=481309 RepID=A0ABD0SZ56_LOXSC